MMFFKTLLITPFALISMISIVAECTASALIQDDGSMEARQALTSNGATVRFNIEEPSDLIGIRMYAARDSAVAVPNDVFTITVSDGGERAISRFDRPLSIISPGREVWQYVAVPEPIRVMGEFFVTVAFNSTERHSLTLGMDTSSPTGNSLVGMPGSAVNELPEPANWMIRPVVVEAGSARIGAPTVVRDTTVPVASGNNNPLPTATASATPAIETLAYRAPNRNLSTVRQAPAIPRGSGRVDVRWNVPPPVDVELSYVGKEPRLLQNLNVNRLVVDFPVPEPGLFNVVIMKPGFTPQSRQFRVVAGGRDEWHVTLEPGELANGNRPVPDVVPVITEELDFPPPTRPGAGSIERPGPPPAEPFGGQMGPRPERQPREGQPGMRPVDRPMDEGRPAVEEDQGRTRERPRSRMAPPPPPPPAGE